MHQQRHNLPLVTNTDKIFYSIQNGVEVNAILNIGAVNGHLVIIEHLASSKWQLGILSAHFKNQSLLNVIITG